MITDDRHTVIQACKDLVTRYRDARDWKQFHNPKELAMALAIEVSELMEHFRFKDNEEIQRKLEEPDSFKEMAYEVSDIFYFTLLLCDEMKIDLAAILKEKMAIAESKYPVELAKGSNKKYTELK